MTLACVGLVLKKKKTNTGPNPPCIRHTRESLDTPAFLRVGAVVLHGTSGLEGAERAPASHRGLGSATVTIGNPATASGDAELPVITTDTKNSTMDSAEMA